MPKISVIVPIFKVEKYLSKCVDSILAQTFTDFEIILVDDGSCDGSGAICDKYALEYENITVIHQNNGGLSYARNSGLDYIFSSSDSDWVAFVDSDDYLKENYLEKLYNACIINGADLSVCNFSRVDENGNFLGDSGDYESGNFTDKQELFDKMYANWRLRVAWNKLYKRSIFGGLRFDNGKIHEDEFIIHKVFYESKKTIAIDEPLYCYLIRSNSIMGTETVKTKLNAIEASINRHWFCKERGIITDRRVTGIDNMCDILSIKELPKKHKKAYKKVFFDDPLNQNLKCKFEFNFNGIFRKIRKRKLKK